jgi:FixJ family two-component response regulator
MELLPCGLAQGCTRDQWPESETVTDVAVVSIVDSDVTSRGLVCDLVTSMKLIAAPYASAHEFLERHEPQRPGCVILEVRIPDMSGLQLQAQLAQRQPAPPVIFLAAYASVPVVVRAMQNGAVHFLQKPAEEQDLWEAIQRAIQMDRGHRVAIAHAARTRQRLESLSDRELEVLELIAQQKTVRRIAHELGVSLRTIESRRVRILKKLQLATPMQLYHFAIRVLNGCMVSHCTLPLQGYTDSANDKSHGCEEQ